MSGGAAPRRKGVSYERDVRDYLRRVGFTCDRTYGAGRPDDRGDLVLDGVPVLAECKNVRDWRLASWIDSTGAKGLSLDLVPFVIVKRPRYSVARSYVVTDLAGFVDFLRRVGVSP